MIIVNVKTESDGKCSLRFEIPNNGKVAYEYSTATSVGEAKRMMYFRLRKYVFCKLHAWIIQRQHAIVSYPGTEDYAGKLADAEILLLKLEYFQKASFWRLCDMIAVQNSRFISLAPPPNSRMQPYFQSTILPILQFCTKNKSN
jgi:hypothetical protein